MAARKGKFVNCGNCNIVFYVQVSLLKRKYCSHKCAAVGRPINKGFIANANNKGKANGRYKHGKRIGKHKRNKKLKDNLVQRDGEWCFLCGLSGKLAVLHIHRIIYGSQGGEYINDNCVLLCAPDHEKVHSNKTYWKDWLLEHIKNNV